MHEQNPSTNFVLVTDNEHGQTYLSVRSIEYVTVRKFGNEYDISLQTSDKGMYCLKTDDPDRFLEKIGCRK